MLAELRISDLGVITEATLDLDPGLTVVTGETGAGKTMIVTGITLLLGGKSPATAVRHGRDRARIDGTFTLSQGEHHRRVADAITEVGGSIDDDEVVISRHLTATGRSRAYLGGAQVPAASCGEVTSQMITVHGQSEQLRLGRADRQRDILDSFAGKKMLTLRRDYYANFTRRRQLAAELDQLRTSAQQRAREVDLLKFGLDEIAAVEPQPGEDHELAAEANRLQATDDLQRAALTAIQALTGPDDAQGSVIDNVGAMAGLASARTATAELADLDESAAELANRVAEVGYVVNDLASDLSRYLDGLESSPGRLEQIAQRRSALAGLTRKYGSTVDEVLAWGESAADQLATLESGDDRIEELTSAVAELDGVLEEQATTLTQLRQRAAAKLQKKVVAELAALALPHARLEFALAEGELGPYGRDVVDLLFSANPGTEPGPLSKIASGGELSRVRLALEVVLADHVDQHTFVFDEVDAGVGGKVAVEIGRRLARLARNAQVIVVTHLAQVAAFADRHYVVAKSDDGQVTTSGVAQVTDTERAAELARMMAGLAESDSSIAHAEELLALAAADRG